jgi:hypothetical protein
MLAHERDLVATLRVELKLADDSNSKLQEEFNQKDCLLKKTSATLARA